MKHTIVRFSDRVNSILEVLGSFLMGGLVIVIGIQVLARYLFNSPLPWSEELGRIIFSWIVFLGTSIAIKRGAHMGLHFIVELSPLKIKGFITKLSLLFTGVFFLIIVIHGLKVAYHISSNVTPAMEISQGWQYYAIPMGAFFALLHIPALFIQERKTGELDDLSSSM